MQDFEVRRASLFASLDSAANEIGHKLRNTNVVSSIPVINEHDNNNEHIDNIEAVERSSLVGCARGQRSLFLRPEAPIHKCLRSRRTPDYQRNPHKWKKYSLADADDSDMANKVGALMFLRKISSEKSTRNSRITHEQHDDDDDEEEEEEKRVKFTRKSRQDDAMIVDNPDDNENSQLRGSKVMMPEYVIGKTRTKNKPKLHDNATKRASGSLKLSHLQENAEEED